MNADSNPSSSPRKGNSVEESKEKKQSVWSREEEKIFENSIAEIGLKWETIASRLPGKTIEEIKERYELLVKDIELIESGALDHLL